MRIERFEDVKAWQEARELAQMVYKMTNGESFSKDFRLKSQIRDAAGSIMHNIAEGFDAGSDSEFIRFLRYSRRSASEVQSQSYVALDQKYVEIQQFQQVYDKATYVKKLINGFIGYLQRSCSD